MKNQHLHHLLPKYVRLRERLRQRILTGELAPHSLLPTEFDLIRTDQVSRGTVVKAIHDLVADQLVYRVQGKGTFVAGKPAKVVRGKAVGLVLQMDPHLFGPMARAVMEQLQRNGHHSLFVDAFQAETESHWVIPAIRDLLAQELDGVVLDGDSLFPFQLLENLSSHCAVTFIFRCETTRPLRANQVLSDDEKGGFLATRHLLDLGHRQILFVPTQTWNLECDSTGKRILRGARKALAEAGVAWHEGMVFERALTNGEPEAASRENKAAFQALLQEPDRPTAVFAFADYIAAELYAGARAAGLEIPRDLAVVGYFNTPWCQMLEPALTSVSVRERELARIAVDLTLKGIRDPQREPECILVSPELLRRDSTGRISAGGVPPLPEILPHLRRRPQKTVMQ